jgi:hypothetical protein
MGKYQILWFGTPKMILAAKLLLVLESLAPPKAIGAIPVGAGNFYRQKPIKLETEAEAGKTYYARWSVVRIRQVIEAVDEAKAVHEMKGLHVSERQ